MRWEWGWAAVAVGLGAPGSAWAQFVVSGQQHATFAEAQAAAVTAGVATITVDGVVQDDSVVVTADGLILDGGGDGVLRSAATSVITVGANLTLTVRNLRLERVGTTTRGIDLEAGTTLTVRDVTFDTGRTASNGGGIHSLGGVAGITLERVTFEGDGTDRAASGGALYVAGAVGPVTLTDVVFDRIEASGNGGAIYSSGTDLTCIRCTFDHTAATNGGAIYSTGAGSLTMENSLSCGASAGGDGGAIHGTTGGNVWSSRFVGGSANNGSAFHLEGGEWTLENDAFLANAGNSAVHARNSDYTFRNNLFHENGADYDIEFAAGATPLAVVYNWFANPARVLGTVPDASNLIPTEDVDLPGDPALVAWSDDDDCSNDDLYPVFDSPLIDAGDPSLFDPDNPPSRSDVGAYGGPKADPGVHGDADGDGASFVQDCNDANAAMYEGNVEICDTYDNDCDRLTDDDDPEVTDRELWHPDCDNDGQGDMYTVVEACFVPAPICAGPWLSQSEHGQDAYTDCNDADPDTWLGAEETCEDGDQNCDGDPDGGATDGEDYYQDRDGDGYGDDVTLLCEFSPPEGYVEVGGDCNDDPATGASFYPGAPDSCGDGFDQDCNGGDGDDASIVYWYPDADHDGYGDGQVAPVVDCLDPTEGDNWYTTDYRDCDDTLATVNPDGVEVCNLLDDDCDSAPDNLGNPVVWYPDADADQFGDTTAPTTADCPPESTSYDWTRTAGDCNDDDPLVHPEAAELCNDVDDDCDDKFDADDDDLSDGVPAYQDRDLDGYGACPDGSDDCAPFLVCLDDLGDGSAEVLGDCDDTNPAQNPGRIEEPGNEVDEDCDGHVEPGRGPDDTDDGRGCNCDTGAALPFAGLLPALALLTLLRRRRQR